VLSQTPWLYDTWEKGGVTPYIKHSWRSNKIKNIRLSVSLWRGMKFGCRFFLWHSVQSSAQKVVDEARVMCTSTQEHSHIKM